MLSRLHHLNLVKFIGICIEERTRCLVYEVDLFQMAVLSPTYMDSIICLAHMPSNVSHFFNVLPLNRGCMYDAPEYAMAGRLLVENDFYSYVVVLLELLSGRKPVDTRQPPKVVAIAFMCVRPSQESLARDSDFKGNFVPSNSSWWNAGGITPRLTYGHTSSFITIVYCSDHLKVLENISQYSISVEGGIALPIRHGNRSSHLRIVTSN
ncbi:unnamed protein product [Fraxinus pennsylvanica]|uniref:Protein kinase domain-containing protein n=1 Tax=Fraxinus pennsylvanica TaxID=56036 RepID=A0AAD1ZVW2_9LAMI|nr:unnamed protein product [Fraxinus pennsylvanica]